MCPSGQGCANPGKASLRQQRRLHPGAGVEQRDTASGDGGQELTIRSPTHLVAGKSFGGQLSGLSAAGAVSHNVDLVVGFPLDCSDGVAIGREAQVGMSWCRGSRGETLPEG